MSERRGMKALEMWCRRITTGYPGVSVDNMTTSWRDGLAFCALIHHFRPDLIDFSRLDKADVYGNNELAFRIAERHLGIPALLDAEDMAEYPVPDRLSIMTYLSQFYQAFASNGSSPVKRASETPDNSLVISDVQSPPQKKPVLGIRKERCHVCNLPVFIAQRLRVNGLLYHRTCFKCSLCGTQLNPASCCEMDGEGFKCESCPADHKESKAEDNSDKAPDTVPEIVSEPELSLDVELPPSTPNKSLVGIRRMMFESYIKDTDDAKLQQVDEDSDTPEKPPRTFQHSPMSERSKEIAHEEPDPCEWDTPGSEESPPEKLPDEPPEKLPDKPPEKPPRSPKGVSLALLTNHSDGPQDTHSLGQVVECSNLVLVNNVDSFSEDTKRSERGEELHADITNLVEAENEQIVVEAVNTAMKELAASDISIADDDTCIKSSDVIDHEPRKASVSKVTGDLKISSPDDNPEAQQISSDEKQETEATRPVESKVEKSETTSSEPPVPSPRKKQDDYPTGLNPFGDDDEEEEEEIPEARSEPPAKQSLNPFGSSSDEDEPVNNSVKSKGLNPFGSDTEDDEPSKPVPLPRSSGMSTPEPLPRNSRLRSSNRSLTSLTSVSSSRKKRPAPPPPTVGTPFVPVPPSPAPSRASISSTMSRSRKTKRAPPPPPQMPAASSPAIKNIELETTVASSGSSQISNSTPLPDREAQLASQAQTFAEFLSANQSSLVITDIDITNMEEEVRQKVKAARCLEQSSRVQDSPKNVTSDSMDLNDLDKEDAVVASSTDPFLNESQTSEDMPSNLQEVDMDITPVKNTTSEIPATTPSGSPQPFSRFSKANTSNRRLIPIPTKEERLRLDSSLADDLPTPLKEKKDKDTANLMQKAGDFDSLRMKKKGRAPLPLAPKRSVKAMPVEQVRQELKDIEIKQQGLERQGIALEHKIRDKFNAEDSITPYVEELVLQLFELVNEKNELFRKQAELMYLRRQHHLEEEQADLEFQIRKLMSQPEANKTDSDKELEERLINRLVEVVERRDAIIQCLEMDRLREAEEDQSIHNQLSQFSQAMGEEENREKLSEKLKSKKSRLTSISLLNLSRDDDPDRQKEKKKKWFTLKHTKNKR